MNNNEPDFAIMSANEKLEGGGGGGGRGRDIFFSEFGKIRANLD